jgi:protease-4
MTQQIPPGQIPPGQGPVDPSPGTLPPPPGANFGPPGMFGPPPCPPGMRLPPPPFFGPPPPRRRSGWRILVMVLLFIVLGFSLILNVGLLAMHGSDLGGQQQIVQAGDSTTEIAVVPLEGEISTATAEKFDRLLTRVEADGDVKAVVIRINTPGGEVTASDEIYQRIQLYKSRKQVPVVISMGAMATSGGYYAACAGDYLFAEHTTLTGNIGVLMPRFNLSKLAEKYGVEENTIVSTGATYKNAGSMFSPEEQKDRVYLQAIIDSAFTRFKEVVSKGRGSVLKPKIDAVADGRVYTSERALSEGLIDTVGYLEDACQYAATTAKVAKPQIVRFEEKLSFFQLFGAESKAQHLAPFASSGVSVNGMTIDQQTFDRFLRPRLLYQWMP